MIRRRRGARGAARGARRRRALVACIDAIDDAWDETWLAESDTIEPARVVDAAKQLALVVQHTVEDRTWA